MTQAYAHLEAMRKRSLTNRAAAENLLGKMTVEQLGWKPAVKSWSAIEVLEHLNIASEKYQALIGRTAARSRERGLHNDGAFRSGWMQRWFINQIEPRPGMRKLSAPGAFRPVAAGPVDTRVRERFFELSDSLQDLFVDAEAVSLSKPRFASPITPLVRFNIGEALWMLVAHEDRHLGQIQRICDHPHYPAS